MDVFSRYAPFVQDFIYENNWQSLRGVQVAAGDAIFNTDDNVLLCASTASGKTEAAFFPILTLFSEDPPASVGCLYIAPLKALINDQFIRLNDLCDEAGIKVWHWHGDVSQSEKRKLMQHPSGILQITPESLEAMLMRRHMEIPHLFGDLRFIVIDEIHSFLRGDRGAQTLCLIDRLSRLAGVNPRRIALSATIGDPEAVGRILSGGTDRRTLIPKIESPGQRWRLSMEHFYNTPPQAGEEEEFDLKMTAGRGTGLQSLEAKSGADLEAGCPGGSITGLPQNSAVSASDSAAGHAPEQAAPALVTNDALKSDAAPVAADPGYGYIFEHTKGRKCLVFSNSREECEAVTTTLRRYCEAKGEPDRFLIHHGNLSTSFRETTEDLMREEDTKLTTCTTATLELGIDIGKLERAFQIDAPATVSSFLQRMGRTGRRGDPEEMWFVMREDHAEPRSLLPESVPWNLIQGIALIQLYLEEHWVEPPRENRLMYSLLYHQTMSILSSGGEMTAAELAGRVLRMYPFQNVSTDDYRLLLQHLIEIDHIQKTEDGGLIVGLSGERVVNNFKFYAVFQENEEYSVRCESQELGTIVKPPPVGDKIAIAGHVWVVDEVDIRRHQVFCSPVKGQVPAYFGDVAGDVHSRILQRMRQVLLETKDYPYLKPHARARLKTARALALETGIGKKPLVNLGGNMWVFFPWTGSYPFLALERFLRLICRERLGLKGFHSVRPFYMQFTMKVTEEEFMAIVKDEASKEIDPMSLLFPDEVPVFDKYDEFLPPELVRKGFAYGVLDVPLMQKLIEDL